MKKILAVGLFAAFGAMFMVSEGHAEGRYCRMNPDDPACYRPVQQPDYCPPGVFDCGSDYTDFDVAPPRRPHRPHPRPNYDENYDPFAPNYYDQGSSITLQFGARYSCTDLANSLRRSGYRRVRPVDCAGRDFAFTAFRDGQSLRVSISSRTGRINNIKPY